MTDAVQRWRAAEDAIYPLAMGDPDHYLRTFERLRALTEELRRTAHTTDDLLAAETRAGGEQLVRAACSVRFRELAAQAEGERRAAVLAAARAEGRDWAVLEGPEQPTDLTAGTSVAVHLGTGRTVLAAVDPYSGSEPYRLTELEADARPLRSASFTDRGAWLAKHARWRSVPP